MAYSSDEDDLAFEKFLATVKTPSSKEFDEEPFSSPLQEFIVSDGSEYSFSDPSFYLRSRSVDILDENISVTPGSTRDLDVGSPSIWSPENESVSVMHRSLSASSILLNETPKNKARGRIRTGSVEENKRVGSVDMAMLIADIYKDDHLDVQELTKSLKKTKIDDPKKEAEIFLNDLSCTPETAKRQPDINVYINQFKKNRTILCSRLFDTFNVFVFGSQLPPTIPIQWNTRLRKTAGHCVCKRNRSTGQRSVIVEMSTKVCDTAERTRDTLIHELCHAAVFLIDKSDEGGHGQLWKYWAQKASLKFGSLPVISRCHSYAISTKFTYMCNNCGQRINRHSKSLDTGKKICGICKGQFELINNKTGKKVATNKENINPQTKPPPKFAAFVKENFGDVRRKNEGKSHQEVMKVLGEQFKSRNLPVQVVDLTCL